ncbi:flagellar hook-associated protein 2 [Natronobacillus azotifigens]|uniref:Flagellar hook-associated protein 2 n=1 Tax=Natronobacillus azotifigens TaxID=472978 RepID=A0A9J6RFG8_9BACI|nr:flagellar hook-associated protein 2 [Natronobacillus azotifigens]MCZ0704140.1 flagellar hook-associated protein 2 [Natronobacillus azotifigens]
MRIGGLATGMDIDGIVEDLMAAERIPLDKMEQDKTRLEWQRDAYRDVNAMFLELDSIMYDMRLSSAYNAKTTTSTQPNAVTATATSSVEPGSYSIEVTQLATNAINVSQQGISGAGNKIDPTAPLKDIIGEDGPVNFQKKITFKTYHNGDEPPHEIEIQEGDSLNSILRRITNQNNGVRAFYDANSDKVIMERTGTGNYNPDGPEIDFDVDDSGFFDFLNLDLEKETGGEDAKFRYNNAVDLTSKTNSATLNGITFNFTNKMDSPAFVTIANDTDKAVDNIMNFVNKYNEIVEKANGKLTEPRNRDYPPLTEAQRNEMSESEIERWEEQAKSGLLRSDPILTSALSQMRQNWSSVVKNEGAFTHISQIGISTTSNYMDGGKLEVDEDKLRQALEDDARSVQRLFSNSVEGEGRGIINRLDNTGDRTTARIREQAGRSTSTLEQYSLGRRLKEIDTRMTAFQARLQQVETRYWSQFTRMEQAIQRMNDQSNYMFQQFNGGF